MPIVTAISNFSIAKRSPRRCRSHSANIWLTKFLVGGYRAGAGVNYVDDRKYIISVHGTSPNLNFAPVAPPVLKSHPAKKVVWAEREVQQPERWTVTLTRPERAMSAEYFVGNRFIKIDQVDATPIGTLTRLHMSIGVSAFWVLLSDAIAGGLILLSLTGLLLWTQLHTVRTSAVMTSVGALLGGIWFMWSIY